MNVYGWIGFWRTLLGIGLGAEVSDPPFMHIYLVQHSDLMILVSPLGDNSC